MTHTHPTGYRETRDGHDVVVLTRQFPAAVEDVWAAVTEPDRLERWIGTWEGDPADGWVGFRMTAESPDASAGRMWIDECDPPRGQGRQTPVVPLEASSRKSQCGR